MTRTTGATATAVIRHLINVGARRAEHIATLTHRVNNNDRDGQAIYTAHTEAIAAEHGLLIALRALRRTDPATADQVADHIWMAWDAGDATYQFAAAARQFSVTEAVTS